MRATPERMKSLQAEMMEIDLTEDSSMRPAPKTQQRV